MCQQGSCCRRSSEVEDTGGQDLQAGGVLVGLEEGEAGVGQGRQQGRPPFPQAGQSTTVHLHSEQKP